MNGTCASLIREFTAHYHAERNHQGLANELIAPMISNAAMSGRVMRRQRLGGVLNHYYREAA